ncbi:hypothetical protein ACFX1Q_011990 [Malus domestica]
MELENKQFENLQKTKNLQLGFLAFYPKTLKVSSFCFVCKAYDDFASEENPGNCTHSLTDSEPTNRPKTKSQERSTVLFGWKKALKGEEACLACCHCLSKEKK